MGFPFYADAIVDDESARSFLPGTTQQLPPFPSGVLTGEGLGPVLHVKDRLGRPLAGKAATPQLSWLLADGTTEVSPSTRLSPGTGGYIMQEFPHQGATVSTLSLPSQLLGSAGRGGTVEGLLPLYRNPLRAYSTVAQPKVKRDKHRAMHAAVTGSPGSFLRLLAAPPAALIPSNTTVLLRFAVEGVLTPPKTLAVENFMDPTGDGAPYVGLSDSASSFCGALQVTATPTGFTQSSASEAAAFSNTASSFDGGGFEVRAFNSLGQPLPPAALTPFAPEVTTSDDAWVALSVVEAAGPFFYSGSLSGGLKNDSLGRNLSQFSGSFADFLRGQGGVVGSLLGQQFLSALGLPQMPVLEHAALRADATANFPGIGLAVSLNTYARFAFSMSYPTLSSKMLADSPPSDDDFSEEFQACKQEATLSARADYWGANAACTSQYSAPVSVRSPVRSLAWRVNGSAALVPGKGVLVSADATKAALTELPFSLSVVASDADDRSLPNSDFSTRLIVGVDPDLLFYPAHLGATANVTSPSELPADNLAECLGEPLVKFNSERIPTNNTDELVLSAFGAGGKFFATLGSTLISLQPMGGEKYNSSGGALPPLAALAGTPGTLSLVAFSLGTLSPPFAPLSIVDNVNMVLALPYTGGSSCPPDEDTAAPGYCTSAANCSHHGSCVCGVCLCAGGYTGAADCSEALTGASDSALDAAYASDAAMVGMFGAGLPVLDGRAIMEALQRDGDSPMELFPRFVMGQVAVGVVISGNVSRPGAPASLSSLLSSLVASARAALAKPRLSRSSISPTVRAGDATNALLVTGSVASAAQNSPTFCSAALDACFTTPSDQYADYRVFAVVVDCARGEEVPGAYFMSSPSAGLDCLSTQGDIVMPASRVLPASQSSLKSLADFSWAADSAGLVLMGVPTGC